jgi:hypothetical protein
MNLGSFLTELPQERFTSPDAGFCVAVSDFGLGFYRLFLLSGLFCWLVVVGLLFVWLVVLMRSSQPGFPTECCTPVQGESSHKTAKFKPRLTGCNATQRCACPQHRKKKCWCCCCCLVDIVVCVVVVVAVAVAVVVVLL